jgi:DNA adenine methylase
MLIGAARTPHGPSFLRWAGSKRQSIARLRAAAPPEIPHYVEPFAGSASLFFALRPVKATLGDLNGLLISTLKVVRERPAVVYELLSAIPRSKEDYYLAREELNRSEEFTDRTAALFIYLNRNCFNGLWRTNKSGRFNVPYGGNAIGNYPPLSLFSGCSAALRSAELLNTDFRQTLDRDFPSQTFIYADPPYFTSTERTFVEYGQKSFGAKDLGDLVDLLVEASRKGAKVALSYSASMPVEGIPSDWRRSRIDITRNVGGFSGSRKVYGEILYLSDGEREEL